MIMRILSLCRQQCANRTAVS